MPTNIFGPVAGGQTTTRPSRSNVLGSVMTWWKGCSSPEVDDGTVLDPDAMNDLIANLRDLITASGVDTSAYSDDLIVNAIRALGIRYAQAGGTANALTASFTPPVTAYGAGLILLVKFASANSGAATINANGLGTKPILRADGSALLAGDLPANGVGLLANDGTNFYLVGGTAGGAPSSRGPDIIIADERPASTASSPPTGTFSWNLRALNTVQYQSTPGLVTLSANKIKFLGAGTWLVRWVAHGMGLDDAQSRLNNVTSGAKTYGLTVGQASTPLSSQTSTGVAVMTVAANDEIQLEMWITQGMGSGVDWGDPTDDPGCTNIYAQIELTKIA